MLVVFDWDGTLCDSTEKIVVCMQRAALELDMEPLTYDAVLDIIGLALPEAVAQLYPGIDDLGSRALRECYSRHFVEDTVYAPKWYDSATDVLTGLVDLGYKIAVATGKSRRGLERNFSELQAREIFHASRCADETASKPDPMMLNQLLEEFSVAPQNAYMVGDTTYDMEMAQRAKVPGIAIGHGAHHLDRLKAFDPVLCVNHLDEMLRWFSDQDKR